MVLVFGYIVQGLRPWGSRFCAQDVYGIGMLVILPGSPADAHDAGGVGGFGVGIAQVMIMMLVVLTGF